MLTCAKNASKRAANKRIIALTQLGPVEREKLINHEVMEVTPNILLVVPDTVNRSAELYTTNLLPAEPRGIAVELKRLGQLNLESKIIVSDLTDYFPDKLSDMQGKRVRVSTIQYPPFLAGIKMQNTLLLAWCLLIAAESDWGQVYSNGSSDGLIGNILQRRAEVIMAAIYRWYNWYPFVWMTTYTGRSGVSCLVPRPRRLPFWQTPFLTFPISLWLVVAISFCVGTIAVYITERQRQLLIESAGSEQRYRLIDAFFFMAGLYVEQSVPLRNDLLAGVVLLAFLLFGGFMVGNSYAGALAYIMTIPRYEKIVETTADFASSGFKLTGGAIAWMNSLANTKQPILVSIRDNFRVYDVDTLARFVHTRRDLGFIHERLQYGAYALETFIDLNATRLLQPLKEDVFWEHVVSACSKTWPLMAAYDDLILRIHQAGILRYWELGVCINAKK
ncbi:uncharacterized protein LOC128270694 [Anopheles cruzii]|uniref:uncharacterized protein LOC128270694 n=1 Tax=Anopheles cruzii TaxID=68878 RepID=UPI0022EC642B|nr:uncharacterized protein LOC128270694 [Anopheles cruzii]